MKKRYYRENVYEEVERLRDITEDCGCSKRELKICLKQLRKARERLIKALDNA